MAPARRSPQPESLLNVMKELLGDAPVDLCRPTGGNESPDRGCKHNHTSRYFKTKSNDSGQSRIARSISRLCVSGRVCV
jgi:hypothetical protein